MPKDMIIVGAGIAGLSTGCYAEMNGFRTAIFESNKVPGGLCAAWARKGYKFDISMHLLANSKNGPFKKMWDELGVTRDQAFYYHDRLIAVEGRERKLDFCLDRERLEIQMLAISPEDAGLIEEFIKLFLRAEHNGFGLPRSSGIDTHSRKAKNGSDHDSHGRCT